MGVPVRCIAISSGGMFRVGFREALRRRGGCPGLMTLGEWVRTDLRWHRVLPDDPEVLKHMLLDQRLESDLLREVVALVKRSGHHPDAN